MNTIERSSHTFEISHRSRLKNRILRLLLGMSIAFSSGIANTADGQAASNSKNKVPSNLIVRSFNEGKITSESPEVQMPPQIVETVVPTATIVSTEALSNGNILFTFQQKLEFLAHSPEITYTAELRKQYLKDNATLKKFYQIPEYQEDYAYALVLSNTGAITDTKNNLEITIFFSPDGIPDKKTLNEYIAYLATGFFPQSVETIWEVSGAKLAQQALYLGKKGERFKTLGLYLSPESTGYTFNPHVTDPNNYNNTPTLWGGVASATSKISPYELAGFMAHETTHGTLGVGSLSTNESFAQFAQILAENNWGAKGDFDYKKGFQRDPFFSFATQRDGYINFGYFAYNPAVVSLFLLEHSQLLGVNLDGVSIADENGFPHPEILNELWRHYLEGAEYLKSLTTESEYTEILRSLIGNNLYLTGTAISDRALELNALMYQAKLQGSQDWQSRVDQVINGPKYPLDSVFRNLYFQAFIPNNNPVAGPMSAMVTEELRLSVQDISKITMQQIDDPKRVPLFSKGKRSEQLNGMNTYPVGGYLEASLYSFKNLQQIYGDSNTIHISLPFVDQNLLVAIRSIDGEYTQILTSDNPNVTLPNDQGECVAIVFDATEGTDATDVEPFVISLQALPTPTLIPTTPPTPAISTPTPQSQSFLPLINK